MDNIFQDHDFRYTRAEPTEANWSPFFLPTSLEVTGCVFKANWMTKSIAVVFCKNEAYTQLCKNCTMQMRLTVLPTDKVSMFLKTTKLQIFVF